MEFRNVNTSNLTFKYPVTWEKEKAEDFSSAKSCKNSNCLGSFISSTESLGLPTSLATPASTR